MNKKNKGNKKHSHEKASLQMTTESLGRGKKTKATYTSHESASLQLTMEGLGGNKPKTHTKTRKTETQTENKTKTTKLMNKI